MRKTLFLIGFVLVLVSCNDIKEGKKVNTSKIIRQVPIAESFSDLDPLFSNNSDTTYVINFWATSCPPCIKEMPHFIKLDETYKEEKFRVLLVSLDMKRDADSRVAPFIEKYHISPDVVLLADQNYSAWTEKVDSSWYGALPATLIFKQTERKFFMGALETYAELEQEVLPFLEGKIN